MADVQTLPPLTPRREQILDLFYAAIAETGQATSANQVAVQLGISQAGVHKSLNRLIKDQYLRRTRRKYRRFTLGKNGLIHYEVTREELDGRKTTTPQLRLGLRSARVRSEPGPNEQMELSFAEAV